MRLTRLDLGLENVRDEQSVILDRNTLTDGTSGGRQGAVQKQITLRPGIKIQGSAFVAIPARCRPTVDSYLFLSLVQDDQTELTLLFQEAMRVGGLGDGHPKRGRVVRHLREKRDRHRIGPAAALDDYQANNAGD